MIELVALVTGGARAVLRGRRRELINRNYAELRDQSPAVLVSTTAPARTRLMAALQDQLTAAAPTGWAVTEEAGLIAVGPGSPALLLEVLPAGVSSRTGASAGHTAPHYWVLDPVWQAVTLLERHGDGYVETRRCTDPALVTDLPFPLTLDLLPPV